MRIPGRGEYRWLEPEPAEDTQTGYGNDDSPHRDRTEAPRDAGAAEVGQCREPDEPDHTEEQRTRASTQPWEEGRQVADSGDGNRDVTNGQRQVVQERG